jgi:hypothetical protein
VTPAGWLLKQRAVGLLEASFCVSLLGARPRYRGFHSARMTKENTRDFSSGTFFGDLSLEILAPIYKEFQRWRKLLKTEFQSYLARKSLN